MPSNLAESSLKLRLAIQFGPPVNRLQDRFLIETPCNEQNVRPRPASPRAAFPASGPCSALPIPPVYQPASSYIFVWLIHRRRLDDQQRRPLHPLMLIRYSVSSVLVWDSVSFFSLTFRWENWRIYRARYSRRKIAGKMCVLRAMVTRSVNFPGFENFIKTPYIYGLNTIEIYNVILSLLSQEFHVSTQSDL